MVFEDLTDIEQVAGESAKPDIQYQDEFSLLQQEVTDLKKAVRDARIAARNPTLHGMDTKEGAMEVLRFKEKQLAEKEYELVKATSPLRVRRAGEEVVVWDKGKGEWDMKNWKVLRFDSTRRTYALYNQAAADRGEALMRQDVHVADASAWETPEGRHAYATWQAAEKAWDNFGGEREKIARDEALRLAKGLQAEAMGPDSEQLISRLKAREEFEKGKMA